MSGNTNIVPGGRATRGCPVRRGTQAGLPLETAGGKDMRCIECEHCLFERIDCDGPLMPCCKNPAARSFDHGLDVDAAACHLFRAVPAGTAYRLVSVERAEVTPKSPTAGRGRDLHADLVRLAGLALLAIAVIKVVRVELLDLFR